MTGNTERRNDNMTPSLTAKSNAGNNNDVILWGDPATHALLISGTIAAGSLTNNNAAPGSNNQGVLPAVASAAAQSYTEGNQVLLSTDLAGALRVTGSLSVGGTTDNSAFTAGTSTGTPSMGFYHSTVDSVTDGRSAVLGMTVKRALFVSLYDAAGNALLGQKAMAASIPVVLASDQASIPVAATLAAETTKVIGTVRVLGNVGAIVDGVNTAATAPANGILGLGIYNSTEPSPTTGQSVGIQLDSKGRQRQVIMDAAGNTRGANVDANNNLGVVLAAETTKVIGTINISASQTIATVTNLAQMNGAALVMGNGVTGTGSQRVTIASDNTAFTVNPASATAPVSTMNSASANAGVTSAVAAVFDDTSPTAITENSFGYVRMSANRNFYVTLRDAAGNERGLNIDASGQLAVTLAAGQTLGTVTTVSTVTTVTTVSTLTSITNWGNIVDNAAFTDGTTRLSMSGFIFDDVAGTALTENDAAAARIDSKRALVFTMEDATTRAQKATVTSRGSQLNEGPTASGSAVAAAPLTTGGRAATANPTAVADGQAVNATFDKLGKQVVVGAIRDLKGVTQTQVSNTTSETTIVAAVASTFLDLYGIILANTGASTTKVTIKDSTAGTTRAIIEVPTLETRGFMLSVDSALVQGTVNNNWTVTCGTATTALEVTAFWVKNI